MDQQSEQSKEMVHKPYIGYRNTTIGKALISAMAELKAKHPQISEALAEKVLYAFDMTLPFHLGASAQQKVCFQARKLKSYKCFDQEWCLDLRNVEVRESYQIAKMKRVIIYAYPSPVYVEENSSASNGLADNMENSGSKSSKGKKNKKKKN